MLPWNSVAEVLPFLDRIASARETDIVELGKCVNILAPLEDKDIEDHDQEEVNLRERLLQAPLIKATIKHKK